LTSPSTRRRATSSVGSTAETKVAGMTSAFFLAFGDGAGVVVGGLESTTGTATSAATSSSATGQSLRWTRPRSVSEIRFIGLW
jgi:hypothetical protein